MSDRDRRSLKKQSSLVRQCMLCSLPKPIQPATEDHLKAHLSRRIAFVCVDCATRVRTEVEMAGGDPRATA